MRDITLNDTFKFGFTTRAFATGIPTTLAGTPVLSVREEANETAITAGVSIDVDTGTAAVTGLHEGTVIASTGNGYEDGKSYYVYISTGTVDGVSVVGEVVHEFTIGLSAAAIDLANGTDGLGAIKTETALIVADTGELQADDVPGLIAALNNVAATDIVSAGAITTLTGAIVNVDLVDTITTYTSNTLQTGDVITAINELANGVDGLSALKALIDTANTGIAATPQSGGTSTWNATALADIVTQVDTALDTAISELGVAAPSATPTMRTGLMLLYMALRNKTVVQTSGTDALEIHNDAGTKIAAKLLTDDGQDYTEAEMA